MRPLPHCLCQCCVLRVFKAMATRSRGKSKQTLKSLRIEPEISCSESCASANRATTAPKSFYNFLWDGKGYKIKRSIMFDDYGNKKKKLRRLPRVLRPRATWALVWREVKILPVLRKINEGFQLPYACASGEDSRVN